MVAHNSPFHGTVNQGKYVYRHIFNVPMNMSSFEIVHQRTARICLTFILTVKRAVVKMRTNRIAWVIALIVFGLSINHISWVKYDNWKSRLSMAFRHACRELKKWQWWYKIIAFLLCTVDYDKLYRFDVFMHVQTIPCKVIPTCFIFHNQFSSHLSISSF